MTSFEESISFNCDVKIEKVPLLFQTSSENVPNKRANGEDWANIIDKQYVLADVVRTFSTPAEKNCSAYIRAGPRPTLYFSPINVRACINLVNTLKITYGVPTVFGIRHGFRGFHNTSDPPVELDATDPTFSQSHRGFDEDKIVSFIKEKGINNVYIIAGIPKTIDNDLPIIDRSFGFQTAVEQAAEAIRCAFVEASCAPNGIGIVKLMGRHSGFIAVHATLADVDADVKSKTNFLTHLENCLEKKGHAVVVVAEGAGEKLLNLNEQSHKTDADGTQPSLPPIGIWIKKKIQSHFKSKERDVTIKYIDPSYMIRSVEANAFDSYYCMMLAQNAVHGALAGFSGFSVGLCNNRMVFLPIELLIKSAPRGINPVGRTIERLYTATQQPRVEQSNTSRLRVTETV
eukprot:GSMAST32.ASY1.ANO1.2517.1 assembled CDS